ncbi:hypothetical protein [Arenibacter nanhaiticus]|nr:hypothetical protein [Arenibacter nanhaiticus]
MEGEYDYAKPTNSFNFGGVPKEHYTRIDNEGQLVFLLFQRKRTNNSSDP